jgi:predicted DNA-binding transcriptional regulator
MNIRKKGNRGTGAALLVIAIIAFIVYAYLLFGTEWGMLVIQLTILGAVAVLLTVLGWIGYTMLTAPRQDPSA